MTRVVIFGANPSDPPPVGRPDQLLCGYIHLQVTSTNVA
jgi:hypothetical protein